ncbi:GPI transamidase component PIG-S, partial [Stegodyphus mimosarum]
MKCENALDKSAPKQISTSSVVATSVFALTFILIGVPVWWKTTEVYRYPVPHEECHHLLSETITHAVPIKIVLADQHVQQGVFWEELLLLSNNIEEVSQPFVNFHWTMSTANDEEEAIIKQHNNVSDLDAAFALSQQVLKADVHQKSYGKLQIIVLPKDYAKGLKFTIGRNRQAYILNDADSKHLAQDVFALARKIAQVERLKKLYTPISSYTGGKIPDKDRMRYLRSSSRFDVTFSLIVPEPHIVNINWDIDKAINAYMKLFLEELDLVSSVTIKSQILYMTSLPIPTQMSRDERGEFVLNLEHLPSLINPIEARLGSDTSVDSNLNFVVYIPTKEQTPLQIYDSKGQPISSYAFLLPQWGGFLMYNCPVPENSSLPHSVNLDVHAMMEVFLSQLRLLLGLPEMDSLSDEKCQVLPSSNIRKWEVDFLLRKNSQEYLSSAISSLSSLSQLLKTIGNIVIRDDVGQKIYFSLSSTKKSLMLLREGYLEEGYTKAQAAFLASDEVFFDPSLLALLYFPEDQKYAIYIPLFLPISIPVITSMS